MAYKCIQIMVQNVAASFQTHELLDALHKSLHRVCPPGQPLEWWRQRSKPSPDIALGTGLVALFSALATTTGKLLEHAAWSDLNDETV
eukprot:COSAG05_NODE_20644_length_278_cov_0.564246_1_plen_87_part_01